MSLSRRPLAIVAVVLLVAVVVAAGLPYGNLGSKALAQYFEGEPVPSGASVAPSGGTVGDGSAKFFVQPGGFVAIYAGFDVAPPNGFLVGVVNLSECPSETKTFSDVGGKNPGWTVKCPTSGVFQIFDAAGVLRATIRI